VTAYNLQEHPQYQRSRGEATFTQRRRARPLARARSRGSGDQRVRRGGPLGAAVGAGEESVSTAAHRAEHVARRTTITAETAWRAVQLLYRAISWLRRAEILPPGAAERLSLSGPQDGFDADSEGRHPD
jgi:hypothetical protein